MEMRRHFGAKAKEKEAKDNFTFRFRWECRLPREVHDAFKFREMEICPWRLLYLNYLSLSF